MYTKLGKMSLVVLWAGAIGLIVVFFVTAVFAQTITPHNSSVTTTPASPITATPQPTPSTVNSEDQSPSTLEILNTIATIATPLLVLILTGVGWSIRNRADKARELEEKLRQDRIQIYNDILDPFIMLFTKGSPPPENQNTSENQKNRSSKYQESKNQEDKSYLDLGTEKVMSLEYKQAAFKLSLIGSDNVLRSYNNLMQFFYERGNSPEASQSVSPMEMISLFGNLLLEIRKSVGNESTDLNKFEMLEFLITDVRKFQKDGKYPT